jgi:hypothetical protein
MKLGDVVDYEGPAYLCLQDEVAWTKPVPLKGSYTLEDWDMNERGSVFYLVDVLDISSEEAQMYAVKGEDWME